LTNEKKLWLQIIENIFFYIDMYTYHSSTFRNASCCPGKLFPWKKNWP